MNRSRSTVACLAVATMVSGLHAQPPGGFGGPNQQERKILEQFDQDKSGWLNKEERAAAREFLKKNPGGGRGPGGMRGPGMFAPPQPGQLFPAPLIESLKPSDEQKKALEILQKDVDAALQTILTVEQKKQFKELRENAGKQFHPRVVDALIVAIERRHEQYGAGHEVDVHDFAVEPPTVGLGSAGLGDLLDDSDAETPGVSAP